MKKIISLILILAILLSNISLLYADTEESNTKIDLKKAIEIAKGSFDLLTEGYDFNQSYYESQENNKQWNLNWTNGNEYINISVDADTGDITNMNRWNSIYKAPAKLPKYKREEACVISEALIKRLHPQKYMELELIEPSTLEGYYDYDGYYFQYVRQVNGVPFIGDGADVRIDKNTLELKNYNFTWHKDALPKASEILSLEEAKKFFYETNCLELSYFIKYDSKTQNDKAVLVYSLKEGNRPIDALTGEPLKSLYNSYNMALGGGGDAAKSMEVKEILTPEEIKITEESTQYIEKDEAIKIAESIMKYNKKQILTHSSLYSYDNGKKAQWNFSWDYNDPKENEYSYTSITIDALTGEIKNFYRGDSALDKLSKETPKYSKEQSKELGETFLKKVAKDKFKETEYKPSNNKYENIENLTSYQFSFIRKINGIPCPGNSLNVTVNCHTGDIISYYNNWSEIEFPKAINIISLKDAGTALFKNADFGLKYITHYDNELPYPKNLTIRLVYSFNDFSGMLDPVTGLALNYNAEMLKEKETLFNDIQGHWAEIYILDLVDAGIIEIDSNEFSPDSAIKQKEFIKILVNALEPYSYPIIPITKNSEDIDKEYDTYYKQAVAKNIIKENEININEEVHRIDGARMLVNAMEIGYLAGKAEIFKTDYIDKNDYEDELIGYVAIVTGLDIMTGKNGYFLPKKSLTKAETAAAIVKYLKIER